MTCAKKSPLKCKKMCTREGDIYQLTASLAANALHQPTPLMVGLNAKTSLNEAWSDSHANVLHHEQRKPTLEVLDYWRLTSYTEADTQRWVGRDKRNYWKVGKDYMTSGTQSTTPVCCMAIYQSKKDCYWMALGELLQALITCTYLAKFTDWLTVVYCSSVNFATINATMILYSIMYVPCLVWHWHPW